MVNSLLELLTPQGDLVTSETYNKLFTIHGVLMVWFFLIPSIPTVLGNFILPMMIGARDVAFPKLNLMSWYIFVAGALVADPRRRGYRLDVLHTLQYHLREFPCDLHGSRRVRRRFFNDRDWDQFHRDDAQNARSRSDLVSFALIRLVTLRDQFDHGAGHACSRHHACAHLGGTPLGRGNFRSETRRRPRPVSAHVFVLFRPRGFFLFFVFQDGVSSQWRL